jgi:2-dehydro-3-deoxyphosphogluconate aldolase/(4S)-4-hydroxy-2-oxoglutarate aldolase
MREGTLQKIRDTRLIAIVRGLPAEQLQGLAGALFQGGIELIEVTFAQNKPETWADTAAGIRLLAEKFAGSILPGAGTVLTAEQLTMAYEAGAKYIISPSVNTDVIQATRALGLVSLPGAMTPSEITTAYEAGADMVKVFPIGQLGAAYIKAIKAPLSHIPLLAVGGVNEKNAAEFLEAGAEGLGVGGNLVNKDWIASGEYEKITAAARQYVAAVKGYRRNQ